MVPRKWRWRGSRLTLAAVLGALGYLVSPVCKAAGPPPVITVQPVSQTVLSQNSVTFSVVALSATVITFHWRKDGVNVGTGNSSSLTISPVQPSDAGSYSVQVINSGGSVVSSNATLTVLVPPSITTPPTSQTLAVGQTTEFSVVASGAAPLNYQWKLNGTAVSGGTGTSLTLSDVRTNQAGSYTVSVTGSGATVTSPPATLSVTNPIVILQPGGGGGMTATGFNMQISVPVGVTYLVLASTNARDWVSISTNISVNATTLFTDRAALNFSSRHYRVKLP